MSHNMGKHEKFLRILLGVVVVVASLLLGESGILAWQLITAFVGLVLIITGIFAYCPANASLSRNSCRACKVGESHEHGPV